SPSASTARNRSATDQALSTPGCARRNSVSRSISCSTTGWSISPRTSTNNSGASLHWWVPTRSRAAKTAKAAMGASARSITHPRGEGGEGAGGGEREEHPPRGGAREASPPAGPRAAPPLEQETQQSGSGRRGRGHRAREAHAPDAHEGERRGRSQRGRADDGR